MHMEKYIPGTNFLNVEIAIEHRLTRKISIMLMQCKSHDDLDSTFGLRSTAS